MTVPSSLAVVVGAALLAYPANSMAAPSPVDATREAPKIVMNAIDRSIRMGHDQAEEVKVISRSAADEAVKSEQKCRVSLHVNLEGTGNYRTAAVSCFSPRWTLYVGLVLTHEVTVPVATKEIPMGAKIVAHDFRLVQFPANDLNGDLIVPDQLIGLRTGAPISPGTSITRNNVIIPMAVQNGLDAQAQIIQGNVRVRFKCRTLQSGSIGDTILAMNASTGKRIEVYIRRTGARPPIGRPFITIY